MDRAISMSVYDSCRQNADRVEQAESRISKAYKLTNAAIVVWHEEGHFFTWLRERESE